MSDGHQASPKDVSPQDAHRDWEWRRKIRSNPHSHRIYRVVVGVVGLIVVVAGLIMLPLPGQGLIVVFLGLAIWASEFEWAQRLLHRARRIFNAWAEWLKLQPWWMKGLVLLACVVAIAAVFWLLFLIGGVPSYLPDAVEEWLRKVPGLAH